MIRPRQPVTLGGITFENKTQATEHVRRILHDSKLGPLDGEAFAIMREAIDLHVDSENKVGVGIARIEVRINAQYTSSTRGFWIVRVDGSETDFSYKNCFDGEGAHRKRFIRACRFAVKEHMDAFKNEFFKVALVPTCALTGVPITRENSHVDHIPPHTFERIVESFIVLNDLDADKPGLCVSGVDGHVIPDFDDVLLRDSWIQYHNNLAALRVVSASANIGLVRQYDKARRAA